MRREAPFSYKGSSSVCVADTFPTLPAGEGIGLALAYCRG